MNWKEYTAEYDSTFIEERSTVEKIVKKEIRKNWNKGGYWKQSIACKIRAYRCLSMAGAWELFRMFFFDVHIEVTPKKEDNYHSNWKNPNEK